MGALQSEAIRMETYKWVMHLLQDLPDCTTLCIKTDYRANSLSNPYGSGRGRGRPSRHTSDAQSRLKPIEVTVSAHVYTKDGY